MIAENSYYRSFVSNLSQGDSWRMITENSVIRTIEKIVNGFLLLALLLISIRIGLLNTLYSGVSITPIWDFAIYYQLANDVLAGFHPYQVTYMQTLGPPLVILPFIPFALFPYTTAVKIFFVGSLVTGWYSLYLLASTFTKRYAIAASLLLSVVLLSSFPARFTLIVGQPHFYILLLIVVILLPFNRHIQTFSSTILMLVKTFFVLPLVVMIFHMKVSWKAMLVVFLLGFSSLIIIKPQYYLDFLQQRLGQVFLAQSTTTGPDYYNQTLRASLQRVDLDNVYIVAAVALLACVLWFSIKDENYEVAILGSIMLSPVVWQHYLVMIFPIIVLLMPRMILNWKLFLLWLIGFILWWVEFPWMHNSEMSYYVRVLASHYFISMCIFMFLSISSWKSWKVSLSR